MLQLRKITKDYPAGDTVVKALKGVSLCFRKSEFVSILGPSGCGKTTLLNIIGGLDQYTNGNLIINGRSTKSFKDRDWDSYRNHSIGFVFQAYNLIPHQSVLQNVELALVLSGVSKSERRARAKKALEDVGLGTQLYKKPSAMSGGQIQRVAIARALVNNPDIILADEPTGALDTETSRQVMDILKEVSKDRLVIMVTHNPDLAKEYSTRIIQILDGCITSDSRPMKKSEVEAELAECKEKRKNSKRQKMPSMSLGTSFMLSLKNLFSKKGRTILTAFAGSIGIIGISLILSISQGTTDYINDVQEDTLASYPLTIERSTIDVTSLMRAFMSVRSDDADHEEAAVYRKSAIFNMISAMNNLETRENDLVSFKKFLDEEVAKTEESSTLSKAVSAIQYSYDLPLIVYTKNEAGDIMNSDTTQLLTDLLAEYMGMDYSAFNNSNNLLMSSYTSNMSSNMAMWQEMLEGKDGSLISDVIKDSYDVVYGSWPNDYNEVVLVLDENNELDDLTLYAMGLIPEEEIDEIVNGALDENKDSADSKTDKWSYEDICAVDYRVILNSSCYTYDEETGFFSDLRNTDAGMRYLYDNGVPMKVVGIIKPNEEATSTILSGSIAYTSELTKYVIEKSQESDAIKAQRENKYIDVVSGLPFKDNTGNLSDKEKADFFKDYVNDQNDAEKAQTYLKIQCIPSDEFLQETVDSTLEGYTRETMEETFVTALTQQMSMDEKLVREYVEDMSDDDLTNLFTQMIEEQVKAQYAAQVLEQMAMIPEAQLVAMFDEAMKEYTDADCAKYYDEILEFSDATYDDNILKLGYVDLDDPAKINIYASTFSDKDVIKDEIDVYNEQFDELEEIKYTDIVGLMMSSITKIINAITYVLIAFVAISLIVSSIMIGVITLISVQERTKEIGILRSIGASKRNVSGMFNAETLIIGFFSGLLGVVVTALLCIPINLILHKVTGIMALRAHLPLIAAIILVIISMLLTLISGIIPSRSAAKKDPVVALRSE